MLQSSRLTLTDKNPGHFKVEQKDRKTNYIGLIEVTCDNPQAFAEIVQMLVSDAAGMAVAAVQTAISCLQMARRPVDRIDDMRMLQDIHHALTGWHFDSAVPPAWIEGVKRSSGAISAEAAQELLGATPHPAPSLSEPKDNARPFDPKELRLADVPDENRLQKVGMYYTSFDPASGADYSVRALAHVDHEGKITILEMERVPPQRTIAELSADLDLIEGAGI